MAKCLRLKLMVCFLLHVFGCATAAQTVIIVMGASCSGKSTLSKKLLHHVGPEWKLVELDVIEDNFKAQKIDITDSDLIDAVIDETDENIKNGYNVVIDTNMYDDKFDTICCDRVFYVLVYCPLQELLARDAQRNIDTQRGEQRAKYAKRYVEKTFHIFESHTNYHVRIDSSVESLDESVNKVIGLLR